MIIGTAQIRACFIEGRGGRSGVSGESRIIRGNPPHRIHGAADGVIFGTKVRLKRKFSFFLLLSCLQPSTALLRAFCMSPRACLLVCLFICEGLRPEETSQQFVTFPPLVLGKKKNPPPGGTLCCGGHVTARVSFCQYGGKKTLGNTLLCFERCSEQLCGSVT